MFSLASCSQPVICEYNSKNILMSFFARLYGSYEDLQIGQVSEALVDFTGGVNTRIKLAEAPPDLWDILTRATYSRSLMGCQTHLGVRHGVTSNGFTAKSLSRPVALCSAGHWLKKYQSRHTWLSVEVTFFMLNFAHGLIPWCSQLPVVMFRNWFIYQRNSIT